MIKFESTVLQNGLKVLVHEDRSTNIATVNVVYKVGSRDENEQHTGFAHLFEHLMFGGSKNIPSYDEPLQKAGGENNAFTTPDLTNYYLTVPSNNLETGLWLESDRMLGLSFDPKVLEVQRKVVIEEFNQRYLNQPYGNVWHILRELAYKKHPYRWPTIGKEISHIENANMDQVKEFFGRFYVPNNATLVLAGNVGVSEGFKLAEKWFSEIPQGKEIIRDIAAEPEQKSALFMEVEEDVPAHALYKVYHMPGRNSKRYYSADLLCDILGRGKSSRLNKELVDEQKIFTEIGAYVTGSFDPGLLVITGKLSEGIGPEEADEQLEEIVASIRQKMPAEREVEKVKNQALSSLEFGEVQVLNRAMNLAYFSLLGDPNLVNKEEENLNNVTVQSIFEEAKTVLKKENSSTLYYKSKNLS